MTVSLSAPTVAGPDLEPHRRALTGHCYRMLASITEAEDAVQETMLRAWKSRDRFDGRAALGTWLHRIATNVCLDQLNRAERRRVRAMDNGAPPAEVRDDMTLGQRPAEHWLEPIPDALALPDEAADPARHAVLRESLRLAFVAALQYLPPRQRAVLLLTQVLDWSAAETAEALDMTVPAVNSALQRARATLAARNPAAVPRALDDAQRALLDRYVAAFEAYDMDALVALLAEGATMQMPPYDMWLRGPASIARWFTTFGRHCRGSVLVPLAACGGMPAFAQYRDGGATPWAVNILELDGGRITGMTAFLDVATLFPRFGLPMQLPTAGAPDRPAGGR